MQPLQTKRLIIREFTPEDRPAVLAMGSTGDAAQRERWLHWTVCNYAALRELAQPPYGDYAVTLPGGEVIGAVGLVPCLGPFERLPFFRARLRRANRKFFTTEVGLYWQINPSQRRNGYASEAADALADFALREMHLDRIVATTADDNEASVAVMKKLGMIIWRNPDTQPEWFQVVGVLPHPHHQTPPLE